MAKLFFAARIPCCLKMRGIPENSSRVLYEGSCAQGAGRGSGVQSSLQQDIFFYLFFYYCIFLFNTCKSQTLIFPSYAPDTILFESNLNYRSIQSFIWQWSRTQNWSLLEIKMYDSQFYFLNCSFGKNIEVLFSAWTFIIFYSKFCRKLAYSPFSKFSNNKDDIFPIVNPMKISKLCVP